MKQLYTTVVALFVLIGCKEQKEDVAPTAFTLNVDASYLTTETDNWVFIHNPDGSLVDHKTFESGDVMIFDKTESFTGDNFSVTIFNYAKSPTFNIYGLKSYVVENFGQEWTLKGQDEIPISDPVETGNFTVNVTDLPTTLYARSLSSRSGLWSHWTTNTEAAPVIREGDVDFLLSVETEIGLPKYKMIENVADQDVYNLSVANDFLDFDRFVDVSFPSAKDVRLYVLGFDDDQSVGSFGYILYNNLVYDKPLRSNMPIGLLNRFNKYNISLSVPHNGMFIQYSKLGPAPTSINLQFDNTIVVTDKSINNYTYTTSNPFNMRKTEFHYINNVIDGMRINWKVYAPGGETKINGLPDEFYSQYTAFNMDSLSHWKSEFDITPNVSYSGFIDEEFKGKEKNNSEIERYTISVQ